jgi:hypothetical protein
MFKTLNFDLEFFKGVQSSKPDNTKTILSPNSSEDGLYVNLSSHWLAHVYFIKKSTKMQRKPSSESFLEAQPVPLT